MLIACYCFFHPWKWRDIPLKRLFIFSRLHGGISEKNNTSHPNILYTLQTNNNVQPT
jgi:hypothetical protein